MTKRSPIRIAAALTGMAGMAVLPAAAEAPQTWKWQESGMRDLMPGYRPCQIPLAPKAPENVTKLPDAADHPQFGTITIGPAATAAKIAVAIELKDGNPSRIWVDGNANGDLTDDPALSWTNKTYQRPDQANVTTFSTHAVITIPLAGGPQQGSIGIYAMQVVSPQDAIKRLQVSYFSDYGYTGEVEIDGKTVRAALDDAGCTGDLRISSESWRNPLLWLDFDGDGKQSGRNEMIVPTRPFEAGGKWWKIKEITAAPSVAFAPAEKPAPPAKPQGPDLAPGQKAPAFSGKTVEGKELKFPDDFKGKLVLIDFWATWCGPCLAEVPNVVAAYEKYHDQGLEVLGVSLDGEKMEEKIMKLAKAKGMVWPHLYDGGKWGAATAKLYGIHSIPHMLLVDGDTGTIIRNKDIRGAELDKAIAKALAERKGE